uniref:Gag-Pol polyprotein n=1 Tax=Tanacetum cinerariifolium TaxID=118510 RepID=A0A699IWC7_TANCI|nr:Gag-Pol polyprotein [Tanacetum cinerariifolium]
MRRDQPRTKRNKLATSPTPLRWWWCIGDEDDDGEDEMVVVEVITVVMVESIMKGKGLRGQCMMDDFGPLYTLSKEEKLDLGNGECSLSSDALLFLPFVNPVRLQLLVIHENIDQAGDVMVDEDEFFNNFSTPVHEVGDLYSRHVDPSNMHTFYQRHHPEHHWTRDHPLEQVIGNPSQPVKTRRQLETDGEMCMFARTVTHTKPKNIKEAMVDHA